MKKKALIKLVKKQEKEIQTLKKQRNVWISNWLETLIWYLEDKPKMVHEMRDDLTSLKNLLL